MSKKLLALLVVAAAAALGACTIQVEVSDSLEQRVSDIELFLNGTTAPVARPDPANSNFESLAEWHERVRFAVCTLEVVTGLPVAATGRLCENGPGDPNGDPPPSPPFF